MANRPLDEIHLRDLRLRCIIGTHPDERVNQQDVVINVTLYADLRQAGKTDAIEDTVDYHAVEQEIVEQVETFSFLLLERLAERVADICLANPKVARARVLIEKPAALRFARIVGVQIMRDRGDDA